MRRVPGKLLLALLLLTGIGCGPKVNPGSPYDQDDERAGTPVERAPTYEELPVAVAGEGAREGTIPRSRLLAVLQAGPGEFLRQLEISAALDGERFVGWQLVQIVDPASPLRSLDLDHGDVLIGVNGASLSRPDELMALWESLAAAPAIDCDLTRGDARFRLHFTVVDDAPPAAAAMPAG